MSIVIRPAVRTDMAQLAQIEAASFSDPWSEKALTDSFENPFCRFFCAEDADTRQTVGYLSLYLLGEDADIAGTAVLPAYRRRGIGRTLLQTALHCARELHLGAVHLEVRASNAPAIFLYASEGFVRDGLRKNYYRMPREDAILMSYADFNKQ